MSEELLKRIDGIHAMMKTERSPWEFQWRVINELMLPRKKDFAGSNQINKEAKRFDSTAMHGNSVLAAAIVGAMTPQHLDWFSLAVGGQEGLPPDSAIEDWTQIVSTKMHTALQQSNFASEFEESLLDLGAPGTGALFEEEIKRKGDGEFRGIQFSSWPIGEYWIAEAGNGMTNRIHREAVFTLKQIVERWGVQGLHESIRGKWEDEPLKKVPILQAIWERNEGEKVSKEADLFNVANAYIDQTHKHLIETRGFNEFPVAVGRWSKVSGEVYGYSPGHTALPDTQVLNEADRLGLCAWVGEIAPPVLRLHESVIGRPDFRAHRINTITEFNALTFMERNSNVNADLVRREDKRKAIREIFFTDQIQFLPERGKTPPSAAEVQARLNIMLQILGTILSRIEWEMLQPVINRTFQIMLRAKQFPDPPPSLLQLAGDGGGKLNISFVGPIARARRQAEAAALDNFLIRVQGMASLDPNAPRIIRTNDTIRHIASFEGIPSSLLKSDDEINKEIADEQQRLASQARLDQAEQATRIAKNAEPKGNPLGG